MGNSKSEIRSTKQNQISKIKMGNDNAKSKMRKPKYEARNSKQNQSGKLGMSVHRG